MVVNYEGARGDSGVVTHVEPNRVMVSWDTEHDVGSSEEGDNAHLRVDLDDGQGFGYALRHYIQYWTVLDEMVEARGDVVCFDLYRNAQDIAEWTAAHLKGTTTDEHRVGLAKALREVVSLSEVK